MPLESHHFTFDVAQMYQEGHSLPRVAKLFQLIDQEIRVAVGCCLIYFD